MDTIGLDWNDTGPRNARTGDVYFSPYGGLEEARHVFLAGNNLPRGWLGRATFTIGEIGFGTGLNFLAAAQMFLETATPDQHLFYVGFEKYPLKKEQAAQALQPWKTALRLHDALLEQWPLLIPGFHFLPVHKQISLLIVHEDATAGLAQLHAPHGIDAWFLDGFAPAKDADAWHQGLYDAMAAHSHNDTRLASFTAVSTVRKSLAQAGFKVKRAKGFAYKWHMSVAGFEGRSRPQASPKPRHAVIHGAGLAGSACAREFARFGIVCTVYDPDPELEKAASGNPWGAAKPRLTARPSPRSALYSAGYGLIRRTAPAQCFQAFPALHLNAEVDVETYGWHKDHLFYTGDASAIAGITLGPALCFPDALLIKTHDLCRNWAPDVTDEKPENRSGITVWATGAAFPELRPVRGQLTFAEATPESYNLKAMLFYGGYVTPAVEGMHTIGATFGRGDTDTSLRREDDRENLGTLARNCPALAHDYRITESRAAIRANTKDRLPMIGCVAPGTYISVGHGSHGLLTAPVAAAIIACDVMGLPAPVPKDVLEAVAGDRFGPVLDALPLEF